MHAEIEEGRVDRMIELEQKGGNGRDTKPAECGYGDRRNRTGTA